MRIAECGLRIGGPGPIISTIRILKSAIHDRLAEAAGVEPARALRDGLANRCHTVRRRLREILDWRKGQDSNPQALSAVVFGTTALPVRLPFQEECQIANFGFALSSLLFAFVAMLAGTLGFEPRISILETDGFAVSLHP